MKKCAIMFALLVLTLLVATLKSSQNEMIPEDAYVLEESDSERSVLGIEKP